MPHVCAAAALVFLALLAPECLAEKTQRYSELLEVDAHTHEASDKHIVWITTFFNSHSAQEQDPHLCAVAQNIVNPQISKVVLLTEDATVRGDQFSQLPKGCTAKGVAANLNKVEVIPIDAQPNYYDFFNVANTRFSGKLVVIANGDVYLGSTIPSTWTASSFGSKRIAVTLSVTASHICEKLGYKSGSAEQCAHYVGAHDAHMFVPPINHAAMRILHQKICNSCPQNYGFLPNRWGAENVLLDILQREGGLKLVNPCQDIHLMHLHCSNNHTAPGERLNHGRSAMIFPSAENAVLNFASSERLNVHGRNATVFPSGADVVLRFFHTEQPS